MKKTLLSIAVLSMLTGCYEDKGSYDYHLDKMNEIKNISFIPATVTTISGKTVELQQPLTEDQTTGHIEVQLEQTLADNFDNLDFFWYLSYTKDEKQVKDTIRTKGYLDVPLAIGKETKYTVMLEIKDNSTSLSTFEKIAIQTRPIFKNSLFVLHGQTGNAKLGNIETIGAETKVRTDAYAVVHPDASNNPFKNAAGLVYSAYMNNLKTPSSRLAVLNTDGTSQVYNAYGLDEVLWKNYVLPLNTEVRPFTFRSYFQTGDSSNQTDNKCVISTDGRFYWSKSMIAFKIPGENSENPNHLTDYIVTTGTSTPECFVFWDQKNNRFIYVSNQNDYNYYYIEEQAGQPSFKLYNPVLNAYVDFTSLQNQGISPENKEAVYAFINYDRDMFSESHPIFIFKDKNAENYYLYELTPLGGDKDKKGRALLKEDGKDEGKDEGDPMFTITGKKLKGFTPNRGVNTILYSPEYIDSYLFYAEGSNLYRYNTTNGDKFLIYQAPEGWNISTMKLRAYDSSNFMGEDADNLRQYICIGMNKGSEGAVTEIKLNTAGDVDEEFESEVYTQDDNGNKFGNIMDLQFAHEYSYYVKNYDQQ